MVVLTGTAAKRVVAPGLSARIYVRIPSKTTVSRTNSIPGADANDLILQMRTWEKHDISTTPGFNGDIKKALAAIKIPFLYMPSETDLYFPIGDARYEAGFMSTVALTPIPSLWGHTAGVGPNPEDLKFLNEKIRTFLEKAGKSFSGALAK